MLPKLLSRIDSRQDLQHALTEVRGVGSVAASALLEAENPPCEVLWLLERGRGIIAGLVIDSRWEDSLLKKSHPDIYSRFIRARDAFAATLLRESRGGIGTALHRDNSV